jgi:hypothetical protein
VQAPPGKRGGGCSNIADGGALRGALFSDIGGPQGGAAAPFTVSLFLILSGGFCVTSVTCVTASVRQGIRFGLC